MFTPDNRTLSEIKNVGAFSLITNKASWDSITSYDHFNETAIEDNSTGYKEWMGDLDKMSQKIFNYDQVKTFAFWFNQLQLYLRVTKAQSLLLAQLQSRATNLINFYKSKHHIK